MSSSYDDIAKQRKEMALNPRSTPPPPKPSAKQVAKRRAFWRAFFNKEVSSRP